MILRALGSLYGTATRWRRARYARHPGRVKHLSRPVISVGNLRAGGSGKTPVVMHLARLLQSRGERPAILSRGYGRQSGEPVTIVSDGSRVLAGLDAAGDEPLMMAQQLPGVAVVVSADRHAAGMTAEQRCAATVHLLDDGFQHLALARDVDLLMVSEDDLTEPLLPAGHLREPIEAAAAADAIVVTTTGAEQAALVAGRLGVRTSFFMTRQLGGARRLIDGQPIRPGDAVFAVAGIARPERFFGDLAAHGWPLAGSLSVPDHHRFDRNDLDRIALQAQAAGATLVLTTEKDAVRLAGLTIPGVTVAAVALEVAIEPAASFAAWLMERLR